MGGVGWKRVRGEGVCACVQHIATVDARSVQLNKRSQLKKKRERPLGATSDSASRRARVG